MAAENDEYRVTSDSLNNQILQEVASFFATRSTPAHHELSTRPPATNLSPSTTGNFSATLPKANIDITNNVKTVSFLEQPTQADRPAQSSNPLLATLAPLTSFQYVVMLDPVPPQKKARIRRMVATREEECNLLRDQLRATCKSHEKMIEELELARRQELKNVEDDHKKRKEIQCRYKSARKKQSKIRRKAAHLIRGQLEKLERLNELHCASIAPIRRVPPEVLVNIFECYVCLDKSPVHLMQVCPHWKEVAWSSPSLWGRIRVSHTTQPEASCSETRESRILLYSFGGNIGTLRILNEYLVCSTEDEVNAAIAHSGKRSPLDLHIEVTLSLQIKNLPRLMRTLMGKSVGHRIWRLKLDLDPPSDAFTEKDIEEFLADSYPALTNLSTRITQKSLVKFIMPRLLTTMATPECLELDNDWVIPLPSRNDWSQMHTLIFPRKAEDPELDSLCGTVMSWRKFEGAPLAWPHDGTPETTFDQLSFISLETSFYYLHRLTLSNLRHLVLSALDLIDPPQWIESSWNLPLLQTLELKIHTQSFSKWFLSFSLPSLRYLEIHRAERLIEETFPSVQFPEVHTVVISGYGPIEWAIGCLRSTPNVSNVTLKQGRLNVKTSKTLFTLLGDSSLYPQAKEVALELRPPLFFVFENSFGNEKILDPLIDRMKAAHPGTRFTFVDRGTGR
ncbi:hypothetical protein FRC17_006372 [Serendipita sp. 399]|nr:hypothetical protein FRC17_006372 [Serendipita sp. 399]